jgi:hypothetical protein
VLTDEPYPWQDLKIDMRSVTAAGKPGSTVLGQTIVPHGAADGSIEVTFPGSIELTSGKQYAVVASTETPQYVPNEWWFSFGMYEWKMPASPYGGGAEWHVFDWDPANWQVSHWDVGLKVYVDDRADTTNPTIDLRSPADGQEVLLGSSLIADFSCADEDSGSGLAMCTGDAPDGAALDTSSVGLKSFSVQASDNAGNRTTTTNAFRVVYDFEGFLSPIENPSSLNSARAGSAVPLQFSLGGNQGLDVIAPGYPRSQAVACNETAEIDGIEETVSAGASGLRYDPDAGRYVYAWKTDKAWAGTCRQLVVRLADGTSHRASFSLR